MSKRTDPTPDELLARIARLQERTGLSDRDVTWQSGIAAEFLREARRGGRRSARNAESWGKIKTFLEAWEAELRRRAKG